MSIKSCSPNEIAPLKIFSELAGKVKKLPVDEVRKDSFGYLELVMTAKNLERIYPILEDYFGPPFKPPGVTASKEASLRAAGYGGIEKQQTLYYVERDGVSNCAMIWPWKNKERATVKLAQGEISR